VGALVYAGPETTGALKRLWDAPAHLVALALLLPLANLALTAWSFHALTRRFARVGFGEMFALICGAFLLNFLPMRPGLFGRVAYHARVHSMRVRDAARVVVESVACGAVAMGIALGGFALGTVHAGLAAGWLVVALGAVGVVAVRGGAGTRTETTGEEAGVISRVRSGWGAGWAWRPYALATLLKVADIAVWAARYVVAFALLGVRVEPREGVALAVVANAASLVPLAGNGLGLREWAVAVCAAALPRGASAPGLVLESGLSADVVTRGAEVVVAVVVGVPALVWVARRLRRATRVSARR
jgi:hypothetical protein